MRCGLGHYNGWISDRLSPLQSRVRTQVLHTFAVVAFRRTVQSASRPKSILSPVLCGVFAMRVAAIGQKFYSQSYSEPFCIPLLSNR